MLPKIPRSNLGPAAEPWSRWADETLRELYDRADRLAIDDGINSRSAHAVIDNLAFQVRDLKSRQPIKMTLATASGTGSTTVTIPNVTFDGPLAGGRCLFIVSLTLSKGTGSIGGPALSMNVNLNGSPALINGHMSFLNTSIPPSWYVSQAKTANFNGTALLRQTNTLSISYTTIAVVPSDTWTITGSITAFPE